MSSKVKSSVNWDKVLSGTASPAEIAEAIGVSVDELDKFVTDMPGAADAIDQLLSARLEKPMNTFSWTVAFSALSDYIGENPATLLSWIASDQDSRLADLAPYTATPHAMSVIRSVLHTHGPDLELAYAITQHSVHDWRRIERQILYDQDRGQYTIAVRLLKNNREEIMLELAANSVLNLMAIFHDMVRELPSREVFGEQPMKDFIDKASETIRFLAPADKPAKVPARQSG